MDLLHFSDYDDDDFDGCSDPYHYFFHYGPFDCDYSDVRGEYEDSTDDVIPCLYYFIQEPNLN